MKYGILAKGPKFQPIRSKKTVVSRFRLVEIWNLSPKIPYLVTSVSFQILDTGYPKRIFEPSN